jgi:formylglycine-generating enzyme required for sulfatase activity
LERFEAAPLLDGQVLRPPVVDDPGEPQTLRVLRGGSWVSDRRYCRLYARVRNAQHVPFALVGVRGVAPAPTDLWASTHRSAGR